MSDVRDSIPPPSAAQRLRLLLVDDHPVLRAGLRNLLSGDPALEVIAEADNGAAAVQLAQELRPDLIIMDVSLPGVSGLEATRQIKQACPELHILALSVHEDAPYPRMLIEAGAGGYVLKRSACEELVRAVHAVARGETYLDPAIAGQMVRGQRRAVPPGGAVLSLSAREEEVLRLLVRGLTMKEMAQQLELSPRTLETYKARAMEKLQIKTRADLVRYGVRAGWLTAQ